MEKYSVNHVMGTLNINQKALAKLLKVHTSTIPSWKKKFGGVIPEGYHPKVDKLMASGVPKSAKKQTRKSKAIQVEEIKSKPEESPMVALVGKAEDVLRVLSNLKLTKD